MRKAGVTLGLATGLMLGLGASALGREQAGSVRAEPKAEAGGSSSSFVRGLYKARYKLLSVAPNPYVPSGFKASPDYTYLYIPTTVYRSPPDVANHRFAPDMRFLLSPVSGSAMASGYSWNYSTACKGPVSVTQLEPGQGRNAARRAAGHNRTRAAEASEPSSGLLGDRDGQWRASPSLADMPLADSFRSAPAGGIVRTSCQDRRS